MPVTKIKSRWDSGNLIFHESSSLATIANVLTIGTTGVTVGSSTNDINFSWLGTTTGTFDLDAGAHTLVTTGLDWTITGDIDLTGNITVDVGDVQIGDNDFLMFGDGVGGDVSARWVSTTSLLEWLPLTDATGAFVIGNGTKNIDFKVWGGSGAGYYLLYDESEDDLILAGVNSQLELESTVNSTTTATGSIHTLGGLGVALNSFFGGTLSVGTISAINAAGPSIVNAAATDAVPTLCPNRADLTLGIGWQTNVIHLIVGGATEVSLSATTMDMNANSITDVGDIETTNAAGPTIQNEAATTTNPTLIPNRADETTGIGWDTAELHFVISGVDEVNLSATALSPGVTDSTALGTSSLLWSDLYLASTAVIYFAADITLTHATDLLTFAGGNLRIGTTDRLEFRDATEYIYSSADGQVDIVAATTVALSGAITGNTSIDVTSTAPTTAENAVAGIVTITDGWASGEINAVYGKVTVTPAAGNTYNTAGGHFELTLTGAPALGLGLMTPLMVKCDATGNVAPNAGMVIEMYPHSAQTDFSNVPFIAFADYATDSGTQTDYLFEVGHAPMGATCSTGSTHLYHNETLKISVNGSDRWIPLSTAQGTYTTAYPIVSTLIGAEAISMGASGGHLEDTVAGSAVGIYVDNTLTSGSYRALRVETLASGASTGGSHYGIRGASGLKTGITSSGAAFCVGTQGKIVSAGVAATGSTFAGVLGQVNNTGTFNTGSKLYAVWADNQLVTCSGQLFMLGLTNTIANKSIDAHMYIYGKAELLIDGWVNQGNWYVATAKTGDADGGSIKINVDGVDKYIQLWSAATG